MNFSIQDFSMDFFSLKGKVAIVTGGNTGLGQGYALALAKAGADLFIVTHGTNWDETRKLIEDEGRKVEFYKADLSKKESIPGIFDKCMELYGRLDILVNNAGTIRRAPITEYRDEDWEYIINTNLNSIYHLSQRAAKIMIKQGSGKIINIASMLSFQGGKFVPPYTASKHGVAGLTKAFANELADKNIQINAIAPGYIVTKNTEAIRNDESRNNEILSRIPAGKWGYPFDVMGTVVFLASRASDYINGHILAVDGGWLVR
ncbi:2-deoxy-D-gluconate 3-dehydrogenase [Clostridium acetobutylicum]|uniref:2 deoxy-D-gluconate 3-dehydrogenase n=1 Tax=Clostridium acetobutylicum (strain ATCC 824 / DSM 792 / JCM 1419 / IAM 19013 / LMG 5710 / NBRC 13948 / NRRL B-527 / VKM B-1787 / 2291 / W) TaxID=272562 RepID=Q97M39_CLOAB|nr:MULTISPECIES: 2-dehydro-3-deoxy-D-gluconate 5-dehydrogenase KduD [Clostridium]AAK78341.1 2 deoxy-D-gluconate 3-dehydrogenase [Clostridium acetobutylicum ATCC 824]ADZ19410.1 2-deoxy-D-gluconate 3-dehydrogenase [Clostridium acetobutylicum EA 2018]AEI34232.1 2-deoxy-D-gluconate 3-dehydrogenase [Clostridium acetobutylicum DSM 1731]AWV80066.1 2-deoxy-D-gluconate 3-dehydrogenase [Clostridium acetobutylicum]MBC2395887.1 2-dehydro-3-deoxy-D-gluconate 5-dehydrogenase KduD [Clostridium acetobutylicum